MKKALLIMFVYSTLFLFLIIWGCGKDKKDDNPDPDLSCSTCAQTPEAKPAHDASGSGIYKGIVVGSTGSIKFDILNSGLGISATFKIDGQTIPLTTNAPYTAGQTYNATFTGTYTGQPVSLSFSVGATGSSPVITAYTVPGHPSANFQLTKETSDNLIKCYEGTFTGKKNSGADQEGTLNIVLSAKTNSWSGVSKDKGSTQGNVFSGTTAGTTVTCNCGAGTTVTGNMKGDQINGTYQGTDNSGTWMAQRTM